MDFNRMMLLGRQFFGGGKPPSAPPAPPIIAAPPSPSPTQAPGQTNLEGRTRQVAMLKYGALSTVTNIGGAAGIASGIEMYPTMSAGTSGKQTTGGS